MTAALPQVIDPHDLPHNAPRRPKTRGFGPLGMVGSLSVGVCLVTAILVFGFVSRVAGLVLFGAAGLLFGLGVWRDYTQHHHGPLEEVAERLGWLRQRAAHWDFYLPGTLTVLGDYLVPGVAAKSVLTQASDTLGHDYALLTYPQTGHHVLNMQASPDGAALADATVTDQQDTHFAEWLASLGAEPDLEQVAITMEIAPDASPAVQREIDQNLDPGSPALSQQMLRDCVKMFSGHGGATSKSFISMTFRTPSDVDKAETKNDSGVAAMRESLSTRLHGLMARIPATGAGPVRLMTEDDVIEVVRCAFNPEDRALYQELRATGTDRPVMKWQSAGPTYSAETRQLYSAGDGHSITWVTTGFVAAQIADRVMKPLAGDPPPAIHTLRITWLYRPLAPGRASFVAEADHRAAKQRKRSAGKDPSERTVSDADAAAAARKAQVQGKGLINFACLVTATALETGSEKDDARLVRSARSGIEHLSPSSKLLLRVGKGAQAPYFSQAIGVLGLVTSAHLLLPTSVRKAG